MKNTSETVGCLVAFLVMWWLAPGDALAQNPPGSVANGRQIYYDQTCYGCHAQYRRRTDTAADSGIRRTALRAVDSSPNNPERAPLVRRLPGLRRLRRSDEDGGVVMSSLSGSPSSAAAFSLARFLTQSPFKVMRKGSRGSDAPHRCATACPVRIRSPSPPAEPSRRDHRRSAARILRVSHLPLSALFDVRRSSGLPVNLAGVPGVHGPDERQDLPYFVVLKHVVDHRHGLSWDLACDEPEEHVVVAAERPLLIDDRIGHPPAAAAAVAALTADLEIQRLALLDRRGIVTKRIQFLRPRLRADRRGRSRLARGVGLPGRQNERDAELFENRLNLGSTLVDRPSSRFFKSSLPFLTPIEISKDSAMLGSSSSVTISRGAFSTVA